MVEGWHPKLIDRGGGGVKICGSARMHGAFLDETGLAPEQRIISSGSFRFVGAVGGMRS
jgi:hypothetical protein